MMVDGPASSARGAIVRLHDRSGDRTHDLKIKSLLLYQLSYPVVRTERDGTAALARVQVKRSSRVTRRPADEGAKLALRRRMRFPATESPALAAAHAARLRAARSEPEPDAIPQTFATLPGTYPAQTLHQFRRAPRGRTPTGDRIREYV